MSDLEIPTFCVNQTPRRSLQTFRACPVPHLISRESRSAGNLRNSSARVNIVVIFEILSASTAARSDSTGASIAPAWRSAAIASTFPNFWSGEEATNGRHTFRQRDHRLRTGSEMYGGNSISGGESVARTGRRVPLALPESQRLWLRTAFVSRLPGKIKWPF